MLYKLLNKILGWDYIHWSNSADSGIARVQLDAQQNPYFWQYKASKVLRRIEDPKQVVWLTCMPEKYMTIFYLRQESKTRISNLVQYVNNSQNISIE